MAVTSPEASSGALTVMGTSDWPAGIDSRVIVA
ncbi:Uncharacterised protein [Mycobacteroides abscessus subsp. abscessus]|nr:Uncharacterised protein [Mycobacteroides abscessus subsp. abscessus]